MCARVVRSRCTYFDEIWPIRFVLIILDMCIAHHVWVESLAEMVVCLSYVLICGLLTQPKDCIVVGEGSKLLRRVALPSGKPLRGLREPSIEISRTRAVVQNWGKLAHPKEWPGSRWSAEDAQHREVAG